MPPSPGASPKSSYYLLEAQYRQLARSGAPQARSVIDQMITLIRNSPADFEESQDRIRILECRALMDEYRALINQHLEQNANHKVSKLRTVASVSIPTSCDDLPCAQSVRPPLCLARRTLLTSRQKKMCIERANALVTALKIEGAIAVGRFDYTEALKKRTEAKLLHQELLSLETNTKRLQNQRYLNYWCHVTAVCTEVLAGRFSDAEDSTKKVLEEARELEIRRCFPNYFQTIAEIQVHPHFIRGVQNISVGSFYEAREEFRRWFDIYGDRPRTLRSDNIEIFVEMCAILDRLSKRGTVDRTTWTGLERSLDTHYTARTTWALWTRLQWLRELSFRAARDPSLRPTLAGALNDLQRDWHLFVPDAVLLGEDRVAGLARPTTRLSFVDIFEHLDPNEPNWKDLLSQNLKNLLLLKVDFELIRQGSPSSEMRSLSVRPGSSPEEMNVTELVTFLVDRLGIRSRAYSKMLEKARQLLKQFSDAINRDDFNAAVRTHRGFFDELRFWPHIVYVEETKRLDNPLFVDEDTQLSAAYQITARRLWNQEPRHIVFETPLPLREHTYYYLRPRWNVRIGDRYRLRHESFYLSRLARWISTFADHLSGHGVTSPARFRRWIAQFNHSERLVACRLLSSMLMIDESEIRELWVTAFGRLQAFAKREGIYIGLGYAAKSGRLAPRQLKQGVSRLPEYGSTFRGLESRIFRDLSEFEKAELDLPRPKAVVFQDDFIGTGGQVVDFVKWTFDKYSWLKEIPVYLCVATAFRNAVEGVQDKLDGGITQIAVGRFLEEEDRAFSSQNAIWSSEEECVRAKQWAEKIGFDLLMENDKYHDTYDATRDALGWHGCQGLVAFHHNIPSDTLPIFWASGTRRGMPWQSLLDRFE